MKKINAGIKFLAVILFTITVFLIDKIAVFVFLGVTLLLCRVMTAARFGFSIKIKHILNLMFLTAFIILLQTFLGGGLIMGLAISCRVFSLLLIYPLFTKTTPPIEFSRSLHFMGVPYKTSFIIAQAFNMAPRFAEEARIIMNAQRLRGYGAYDKPAWNPLFLAKKIKAYASLCLPLVLGAMRKARDASLAMDSRAFGAHKTRAWLHALKLSPRDYLFIFGCLIFAGLLLAVNHADYFI